MAYFLIGLIVGVGGSALVLSVLHGGILEDKNKIISAQKYALREAFIELTHDNKSGAAKILSSALKSTD